MPLLRSALAANSSLKLILMSATMDTSIFSDYFSNVAPASSSGLAARPDGQSGDNVNRASGDGCASLAANGHQWRVPVIDAGAASAFAVQEIFLDDHHAFAQMGGG
eukprot:1640059-Pleurochrysis_carterae.AAC.1